MIGLQDLARRIGARFRWKDVAEQGRRELDDQALARHMRALGVRLRVDGRARLRLARTLPGELRRLEREALTAQAACERPLQALARLDEDARLMAACAGQVRAEAGPRLPACEGVPRVLAAMRGLSAGGDVRLTRERFLLAVATFDDVQALTMAELWSAATALRIAVLEDFVRAARSVLRASAERCAAEAWLAAGGVDAGLDGRGAAFFARALQLTAEEELPEARQRLEEGLSRANMTGERCVRAAHEAQALDQMRLDNLVEALRMLDALDGQACFAVLSRTEAELCADPAGVYAQMDETSRAAVRREVEVIARRLRLGETAVAHHAAAAAREAAARGEGEARGTVCWWLYSDAGRRALRARLGLRGRLPRLVPDPRGRLLIGAQAALCLLLLAGLAGAAESLLCLLPGLPLAWQAAGLVMGRLVPRFVRPKRLLRLDLERLGEQRRTLVVVPALLSSPARAAELCAQLETHGCLEADPDMEFLLLGDFRDAPTRRQGDDAEIVRTAREGIAALNRRAGREKYAYLQREREYAPADDQWRGRERKRGALMALNRLLLDEADAAAAFGAENAAAGRLAGRFAYVVTLDADTSMLPGTVRRLVGTLAHPLNRLRVEDGRRAGYAILQPNMELRASACGSRFARLLGGRGGVDSYPVSVSNLHQDLTGRGLFGGKGVYALQDFQAALDGALPDGCVLSHDLLEGLVAGAGFVSDVSLYDGFPATLSGYLKRLERWTRGDWQLAPFLAGRRAFAAPRRLDALDKYKLLDNLLRSLAAPALLGMFLLSAWLGWSRAFALGVICAFGPALLNLPRLRREDWRRAAARLALLPMLAQAQLGGALRGLWRRFVSHRRLLDWVTAADAEGASGRRGDLASRGAALLLLPALLRPAWAMPVLALGALFWLGPDWLRDLETATAEPAAPLTSAEISVLMETARETWRFFERCVPADGPGLPPDNVQVDPPRGAAPRTSPTNIGLYMLSCLSAEALGFLRREELLARLERTTATLEGLEKWHGQLYNWYDTESLAPLRPRYVSSVDGGNLAACLLLLAQALPDAPRLAGRLRALAEAMDFRPLYDAERKLFLIGIDVENDRASLSHYDLLASEARILSYVAMMLGQVAPEHWRRLSRATVPAGGGQALVSWSGTLFEYLMPELFLRAPAGTLLGESARAAAAAQKARGAAQKRPWGISESGYYAFDQRLNYQYRAFGLRELALSGASREDVVAPYASALALAVDPSGAAQNLIRMRALGWADDCGFYEAADYGEGEPRLVRSHMAHHQGMALCAMANALTDDALVRRFMAIPEARALSLLLEEKPSARVRLRRRERKLPAAATPRRSASAASTRATTPEKRLVDAHLLAGAGTTVQITARGDGFYQRNGILANAFGGDYLRRREGVFLHARLEGGAEKVFGGPGTKVDFRPGSARYSLWLGAVELCLTVCVSPEDGALFHRIEAENHGGADAAVVLTDCLAVALAGAADLRAHPAFQKLFVESALAGRTALRFTRRPRRSDEALPELLHLVSGGELLGWETDLEKLLGRSGELSAPDGLAAEFSGSLGAVLNPGSALRVRLALAPGERRGLHFALGLMDPADEGAWLDRNLQDAAPERACQLAETQAQAQLDFIGLDARGGRLLQRASVLLTDAHLAAASLEGPAEGGAAARELWALGISGDLPIVCVRVSEAAQLPCAREAIRLHEFYRSHGLWCDLVFVNEYGGDYEQPLREALRDLLAASHLRDLVDQDGGVRVFAGGRLSADQRRTLERAATLRFAGAEGFYPQLQARLAGLNRPEYPRWGVLPAVPEADAPRAANGFGDFTAHGDAYRLRVGPGRETPAPWSNVLVGAGFGALLTERGGGFFWMENSRNQRLTPFDNDALSEGWGIMLYLYDPERRLGARLLPGKGPERPYTVAHGGGWSRWESAAADLEGSVELYVQPREAALLMEIEIRNPGAKARGLELTACVDWLMGVDAPDARRLRVWGEDGVCYAAGAAPGVAYLAAPGEAAQAGGSRGGFYGHGGMEHPEGIAAPLDAGGQALRLSLEAPAGAVRTVRLRLGWAEDLPQARRESRQPVPRRTEDRRFESLRYETPDRDLNHLLNHFLPRQVLDGRVRGRCGLYQAGGAFGFRDQLQDMLALLPYDPARVRAHLLECAARQFLDGDVLHWWHAPRTGVRTRISDDMLFLPYVCARYVRETGDAAVLSEAAPFLEDVALPPDREDYYGEMRESNVRASLHEHCMRAFRRAARTGAHGLALMGSGDWNDGMNRVGAQGRGESVWLSQFLSACAGLYAEIAPSDEDRAWLVALSARMNAACEEYGWDGEWYLRAWTDAGEKLGTHAGEVCRIDLIPQAWAVLAGLDDARCAAALDSAWRLLVDEEHGLVRLLTPPFDGAQPDPGYIRGYPPGVRENGGQYTHAACWYLLALARRGDHRAHRVLQMLLPTTHARTEADARRYRVEPYVLAADIYGESPHAGRGGWTWYTGAAGWLLQAVQALLGYERRGDRVRLCALLGDWPEVAVILRCGASQYRLVCRADAQEIRLDGAPVADEYIRLVDDGKAHEAVFPPRQPRPARTEMPATPSEARVPSR